MSLHCWNPVATLHSSLHSSATVDPEDLPWVCGVALEGPALFTVFSQLLWGCWFGFVLFFAFLLLLLLFLINRLCFLKQFTLFSLLYGHLAFFYICYSQLTNIDTLLLTQIQSLFRGLPFVLHMFLDFDKCVMTQSPVPSSPQNPVSLFIHLLSAPHTQTFSSHCSSSCLILKGEYRLTGA